MDTLAGILLPEQLHWENEFDWSPVNQSQAVSLSGKLIVEEDIQVSGRPMTLAGSVDRAWTYRPEIRQLTALEAIVGSSHTLIYRGQSYTVIFDRRDGAAVRAFPIFPWNDPEDSDPYRITIRLQQV